MALDDNRLYLLRKKLEPKNSLEEKLQQYAEKEEIIDDSGERITIKEDSDSGRLKKKKSKSKTKKKTKIAKAVEKVTKVLKKEPAKTVLKHSRKIILNDLKQSAQRVEQLNKRLHLKPEVMEKRLERWTKRNVDELLNAPKGSYDMLERVKAKDFSITPMNTLPEAPIANDQTQPAQQSENDLQLLEELKEYDSTENAESAEVDLNEYFDTNPQQPFEQQESDLSLNEPTPMRDMSGSAFISGSDVGGMEAVGSMPLIPPPKPLTFTPDVGLRQQLNEAVQDLTPKDLLYDTRMFDSIIDWHQRRVEWWTKKEMVKQILGIPQHGALGEMIKPTKQMPQVVGLKPKTPLLNERASKKIKLIPSKKKKNLFSFRKKKRLL